MGRHHRHRDHYSPTRLSIRYNYHRGEVSGARRGRSRSPRHDNRCYPAARNHSRSRSYSPQRRYRQRRSTSIESNDSSSSYGYTRRSLSRMQLEAAGRHRRSKHSRSRLDSGHRQVTQRGARGHRSDSTRPRYTYFPRIDQSDDKRHRSPKRDQGTSRSRDSPSRSIHDHWIPEPRGSMRSPTPHRESRVRSRHRLTANLSQDMLPQTR